MNKYILLALILTCNVLIRAQVPQRFNYQAVARNALGAVLANQSVAFRFSIVQGEENGTVVYSESHNLQTNSFGLVNTSVGNGMVEVGNFNDIDWSSGTFYLRVEMDPNGSNNYVIAGENQLLSVPYALHSGSSLPGPQGPAGAVGATGPSGADGKTVLNGTSNPTAGIGTVGDFYINTSSNTLFGPKTAGGWGSGTSLVGPAGATGPQGPQGAAGSANAWGLTGSAGTNPSTNYIGTSDNQDLVIKRNSILAGRIGFTYVSLGRGSMASGSGATNNSAFGANSLSSNTTGTANTAIGANSMGSNLAGSDNIGIGRDALFNNTTASENVAIGTQALFSNISSTQNTAIGHFALRENTGGLNTAVGWHALQNTLGAGNTALGNRAGKSTSLDPINLTNCTFLGNNCNLTQDRSNVTMLGSSILNAQCSGNNQVLLGSTAITQIRAQVSSITAYSDGRYKINVSENVKGLDFIKRLRPVSYHVRPSELHRIWGTPDSLLQKIDHSETEKMRYTGFIAQEVEQAMRESGYEFTGIDIPQNEHETYTLRYTEFIMPMVKAIQEQQDTIEELRRNETILMQKMNEMEVWLRQMKALVDFEKSNQP